MKKNISLGDRIDSHSKETHDQNYIPSDKRRTTLWIDSSKWRTLKLLAMDHGTSMTALVDQGIDLILKKYNNKK